MAKMVQIRGIAALKAKLKKVPQTMAERLTVGLERAGLYLQRESQKIVPVDTGNLRNSAFTRVERPNTPNVEVHVGYTASYAVFVHEDLHARHKPGKSAKFLEGPARERRSEIIALVRKELIKW